MSSNFRFLANIWATKNLAGIIVISVMILGLKFLPYIADSKSGVTLGLTGWQRSTSDLPCSAPC